MATKFMHDAALSASLAEKSIPEPNSGCVLWTACVNPCGYGLVGIGGRKITGAHRVAWRLAHGPIPAGMHVLHKCDVPSCINPAHLFLGTHAENMADRNRKGRARGGNKKNGAKLTADQVRAIRVAPGTQRDIARRFGIHRATVNDIFTGKTWRDTF